ncbi:hypothetical protein C7B61_19275 [filamentous cyanobacterium CCP1]|nr:hypothetical protein C7B76_23520 [filamentous cyanobacterium CCP2]PSB58539.1 hypothetical protein C7B61_19275 [filamentous cyanobacterium CCP1]
MGMMLPGCIPLLHFHDKYFPGQDACATEIAPFASLGCSLLLSHLKPYKLAEVERLALPIGSQVFCRKLSPPQAFL